MPGEGSVFQRASDGKWIVQVSIGPREDRRYRTRTLARKPTRAEVRVVVDELRSEHVAPASLTVGAYLERWVNDARNIRPTTRHGYRVMVTYHLAPTIGDVRLADLSPLDVERMLSRLAPKMSAKTLRNAHGTLRRALGQAVRAGLVARNVAAREFVDTPRVTLDEPRSLSEDEVHRLLAAAAGDRLEALFVLAVGTGLRQGELLGLAWEDVTPAAVTVRKELVYRNGRYSRDEPKTERSKRVVPLSPSVAAAMVRHRERIIAAGFVPTATGPVFVSPKGTALSGSWVTHHFYGLLADAGIPRLPFKNLRTTFASRLHDAGVSDVEIAALMGHATTATTKRHYIARGEAGRVRAVEAIEGLLRSVTGSVTEPSTMHADARS